MADKETKDPKVKMKLKIKIKGSKYNINDVKKAMEVLRK
jgi:hypothetical protein